MKTISGIQALRQDLDEELRRDANVILMGEDIGTYGGAFGVTRGLLDAFGPERIMFESNVPVDRKGADYAALWQAFGSLASALSTSERDQLFYATAARVYRL